MTPRKTKPRVVSVAVQKMPVQGGLCCLDRCHKKPVGKRDGPGKLILAVVLGTLLDADCLGARSDGGFDPDSVDWSEFRLVRSR